MRKALTLALVALAMGATGTPAQAADYDAALVAAARKEGQVVWYTSFVQNQLARPMADAFEKKFPGIKVEIAAGTVTDLLTRLLAEGRANNLQADVSHAGNAVGPLRRAGLLAAYTPKSAAVYPAAYKDPEGYWNAQVIYALAPAVNTSMVKEADWPKTYQDLLNPKWKGQLPWTNQMAQSGPPAFIAMIKAKLGPEGSDTYFRALAPNIVNVPANQRVVLDQVIAGQYPLAMMMFSHHAAISQKQGAPVEWLALDPVIQTMDTVFLLRGPHPNAGKLFIEFILADDGQKTFEAAGYVPAHPELNPLASPKAGAPQPFVLTPEVVDAGMDGWIATFDKFFK